MQRTSPNHAILAAEQEPDDTEDSPFHDSPFRVKKDLQQTLQDLDDECYKQSGCLELPGVLARCEKQRATCPDSYYYELRQLNRNCRALSTQKLEDCLLQVPSGKCIFEHPVRWCNVTEILECSEMAMDKLLKDVLLPPFSPFSHSDGAEERKEKTEGTEGGVVGVVEAGDTPLSEGDLGKFGVWELALHGAFQASKAAQESSKAISLLGWALKDGNFSDTDDDFPWQGSAQELFANVSKAAQSQPLALS